MFTLINDVRKSVKALEGAESRGALHMFTLGLAHFDVEEGKHTLSVANLRSQYKVTDGFSSTSGAAIGRYRIAAVLVATIAESEADVTPLMREFNALQTPGNAVAKKGLKKDELAEYAADVRQYVTEGMSPVDAIAATREDWTREVPEDASQPGKARPNDGSAKDEDGAGDPGSMSRTEALQAAVRLLGVAAKDITPTEAGLMKSLIADAYALVADLTDAVDAQ